MKLLVLSDLHGCGRAMMRAVDDHPDAAALFFLGDGLRDVEDLQDMRPHLPVYLVRGNCDIGSYAPTEGLTPMNGQLIFYTHGHLYGVKTGLDALARHARQIGADIALFGHTHKACHLYMGGVHLFNPGALSGTSPRYGVVTLQQGRPPVFQWEYL